MHTLLFNHRDLFNRFRAASDREDDVHARLYKRYREVPDWWYLVLFTLMMVCSIVVCEAWDTRLPWWGFLVTQSIPFIFTLPIGMVAAVTNVGIGNFMKRISLTVGLNVITEFIAGYMFPGRPLANMMIKTYGYMTLSQVRPQKAEFDRPGTGFHCRFETGVVYESSSQVDVQNPDLGHQSFVTTVSRAS